MNLAEAQAHYGCREWGLVAPLAVRLLRRCVEVDGCWLWQGAKTEGYGRVQLRKGTPIGLTHRAAYELFVGPVPAGLHLDHLCRQRACLRPDHLEPVTTRVNTLRGVGLSAINAQKTECKRGHSFTPENTRLHAGRRYCRACAAMHNAARTPEQRRASRKAAA